jgi:hypothetical protein
MSDLVLRLAGDVTQRGMTTRAGLQVFSAHDFINLICNKNGNYSKQVWKRLIDADSEHEIEFTMEFWKYQDGIIRNSTRRTPMMTLRALQRLVLILGGKVAAEFRQIVEGVFTRFQSGDLTMIEEIRANAASSAPIHQDYRQALAQEPVTGTAATTHMIDHDEALFNLELHERQMALHERQMTLHERSWALYEKSLALQRRT